MNTAALNLDVRACFVSVSGRPGVPDALKSRGDAEFWHAWRPLDIEK